MSEWLKSNTRESFRVDTRTLAVFRVFAGLLILADLVLRSRNLVYFYSDEGVYPRSSAEVPAPDPAFSVYWLSGDPVVVAGFFLLTAMVAVQLIVGYKTRLATVLAFLLVVSLDLRNTLVLSYADILFRMLLFWAIFLPLGERWSVDAVHRERGSRDSFVGVASALILMQMVVMYFVNGAHKRHSSIWGTGDATPIVMGLDHITFLLGPYMHYVEPLLAVGGLGWYHLLLLSPLLLVPSRLRMLLAGLFAGGHLAFAVTVRIGAFPYVAFLGLVLFLQRSFWRDARLLLEHVGVYETVNSVYKGSRERCIGAAGVLPRLRLDGDRVGEVKRWTYTTGLTLVVVYALVMAFFVFLHMGWLGGGTLMHERVDMAQERSDVIDGFFTVTESVALHDQIWQIFAPDPMNEDRYYVYAGLTAAGGTVDASHDRALEFDRPYLHLHRQYERSYRERFYFYNLEELGVQGAVVVDDPVDPLVLKSEYLCEGWRGDDGERLSHVNIYSVREYVDRESAFDRDARETTVFRLNKHGCGDREPREIETPEEHGFYVHSENVWVDDADRVDEEVEGVDAEDFYTADVGG